MSRRCFGVVHPELCRLRDDRTRCKSHRKQDLTRRLSSTYRFILAIDGLTGISSKGQTLVLTTATIRSLGGLSDSKHGIGALTHSHSFLGTRLRGTNMRS